ncbi:uncharacterized protein N7500_010861 [Penicillium coprophilum]|uniref:uncharacterized protein n=1 Tax=Penicillium coprophilum TaxID=36646 RepID=UPI00238E0D47|nr:uncharacterized protein N7500_010861 [Penicillium coprophilum]KAJ5150672.1 hypothetical protein N7500_010861 [Penicillium coprophilum]
MLKIRQLEVKMQGHMTCTDKQSPRPLHLCRHGSYPRAIIPCVPITFRKPELGVNSLPLEARMATADGPARVHDRNARRRPFSSWVKRLANLKSSSDSTTNRWTNKRSTGNKGKKSDQGNNPYPLSGTINRDTGTPTPTDSYTGDHYSGESRSRSDPSLCSGYENPAPLTSAKSAAPTISTNGDAAFSEAAYSKAGTLATGTEGFSTRGGGEGSTFSSPAPSIRSMTTTLTTVHSAAPSTQLYNAQNSHNGHHHGSSTQSSSNQQIQFSHQFPSTSPATAVPPHLVPPNHTMTYSAATANNALTDNASLLTLASSSKRRRRNSLDTNASVRGLAPSSVFGGSRESLPLSVLSGHTTEASNTSVFNAPGVLSRPSIVGLASAERISVYSASGAIPLASTAAERGSFYTTKQTVSGDTASIRSGAQSHSRNDSTAASIAGGISSPLAMAGRMSRRSSGWGEITGEEGNDGKPVEKNEDETAPKEENGVSVEPLKT